MRTTLTLDSDIAKMIKDEAHRQRRPVKQVVNEAIRRGLAPNQPKGKPYRVAVHRASLRPGIDPAHLNGLADELEVEASLPRRSNARRGS